MSVLFIMNAERARFVPDSEDEDEEVVFSESD
jgi:hypothetical protein